MILDGLRALLANESRIHIDHECLNGKQVLNYLANQSTDVVVMDISMPEMDGIEATRLIKERHPEQKVLILTMHKDLSVIKALLAIGADGFILKNTGKQELVNAIEKVANGQEYYGDEVSATLIADLKKPAAKAPRLKPPVQLTKREKEVLKLIVEENTTQEIAEKLFISTNTVETHRKNMLSKLEVRNIAGLVRYALENKLVDMAE